MVRQGSQKLNEKIARNKRLVTIATIIIVVAIAFEEDCCFRICKPTN